MAGDTQQRECTNDTIANGNDDVLSFRYGGYVTAFNDLLDSFAVSASQIICQNAGNKNESIEKLFENKEMFQ